MHSAYKNPPLAGSSLTPYGLPFLLSMSGLIYELSFAKTLVLLLHGAKYWESLSLGVFMAGVGLGLLSQGWVCFSRERFSALETCLGVLGPLGILALYWSHLLLRLYVGDFKLLPGSPQDPDHPLWMFGVLSLVGPLGIGVLSGLELLWISSWWQAKGSERWHWGRLLGAYHFGALAGSMLMVWLHGEPQMALVLGVGLINLMVAGVICRGWWVLVGLGVWVACGLSFGWVESHWLKGIYYDRVGFGVDAQGVHFDKGSFVDRVGRFLEEASTLPEVESSRSFYQTIHVVREPGGGGEEPFSVYLNLEPQFYSLTEHSYHRAMVEAAGAVVASGAPCHVLVIGGGDGLLARDLLRASSGVRVTLVELDSKVLELARQGTWGALTQGSLSSPRVKVVNQDGFSWLRTPHEPFDGVLLDLPYPVDEDILRLYSYEFYRRVWKRLKPGGVLVLDAPVGLERYRHNEEVLRRTLAYAGFDRIQMIRRDQEGFVSAIRGTGKKDGGEPNSIFYPVVLGQ